MLRAMKLVIALICVLLPLSTNIAAPKDSEGYSKRILGRWLNTDKGKLVIFHSNGSWGVQRNEETREKIHGRWHIRGNKLILTYPSDEGIGTPVHILTGTYTIISFTPKSFVTETQGYKQFYERSP